MVNLLIPAQDRSWVSYGCASHGLQISPLRVLFLKILKIFCPSEVKYFWRVCLVLYAFWGKGWYLSVAQDLEEGSQGHNSVYFTHVARTILPVLCGRLKAERQNNNSLIQILRVILMRRAGNSFLESECIDSREKNNDPQVHGILGVTIHRDFLCS